MLDILQKRGVYMDSNKALREALRRTQEEANENSVEDDILKLMQEEDSDLLNTGVDSNNSGSEELKNFEEKSELKSDVKKSENKKENVKSVTKESKEKEPKNVQKEQKDEQASKTSLDEKKESKRTNIQNNNKKLSESELARVKEENRRKLEKKRVKKARQKSNVKSFDINSDENKKSAIRSGVKNNNIYYTQVANIPRKMLRDIQSLVPEARNKDEAMIAYIVATNNIVLTKEDNKYLNVDKINYLASSIRSNDTVIDSINTLSRGLNDLDDKLDKQDKNQVRNYVQNEKILLALALLLSERLGFRQTGFTEASNVSFLEEVMLELLNKLDIDVKEKIRLDKERSGRPIR